MLIEMSAFPLVSTTIESVMSKEIKENMESEVYCSYSRNCGDEPFSAPEVEKSLVPK